MEMVRIRKLFVSFLVGLIFTGCTKTEVLNVVLKEGKVEVNSLKSSCSLVETVNSKPINSIDEESNTMVAGEDLIYCSKVDFSTLGEVMIEFSKGDSKAYATINVVDETEPTISTENNVVVEEGNTYFNLESLLVIKDNFDSDPIVEYEGSYDINTIGMYKINVIAKDSSNNTNQQTITIEVIEKEKEVVIVEVPQNNNQNSNQSSKPSTEGNSSGSKPTTPSKPTNGSNNQKPNNPKPSDKFFMYVDGYNMDSAYKACVEYITQASKYGYGGVCASIDEGGVSKGYKATIN